MKQKNNLILDNEFLQYCEINNIDNIEKLAKETFNRGFTILKYGETPFGNQKVKEVIKEVEKIVEVIKEVPVEVIKEVIVEKKGKTKEIKIVDTTEIDTLKKENQNLKDELSKINEQLNKLGKGRFLKNSNLGSLYDE